MGISCEYLQRNLRDAASAIKATYPKCRLMLFSSYSKEKKTEQFSLNIDLCVVMPETIEDRKEIRTYVRNLVKKGTILPISIKVYTAKEFKYYAEPKPKIVKRESIELG